LAALSLLPAIFSGEPHINARVIAGCGASASRAISSGYSITLAEKRAIAIHAFVVR
jgi:hypothetical protein